MKLFLTFCLVIVFCAFGYFLNDRQKAIPSYAEIKKSSGVVLSSSAVKNNWFPKATSERIINNLNLTAKSAIAVDYDTGEVLYFKNPKERLPVASTVKIMTALLALENKNLSEVFTVSDNASRVGENSMGLKTGEKLKLVDLLYGMMLVSGNDSAVSIAENISGSEVAFVESMNQKASTLGLVDTKFINASGLDVDGEKQYSTAYDMTTIARYAWENYPDFRKITSTYHYSIEESGEHSYYDLYNDTNLLTTYPGVKGIKPGFTWEANYCLVTYAENNGKKIIAVILGSDNRRMEMKELLDFSFGKLGVRVEHPLLDM